MRVHSKRTTFQVTYSKLFQIARFSFKEAMEREEGSFHNLTCAMLFSVLAVEAFLNHAGEKLVPKWTDRERRLGARDRLKEVYKAAGLDPGKHSAELALWAEMLAFRDLLVHGRSETIHDEAIHDLDESGAFPKGPLTIWDRQCSRDNAERFLAAARKLIALVRDSANVPLPDLRMLGWSGGEQTVLRDDDPTV